MVERAWLLLAVGEDRQHGGNDGYSDEPDAYYSWDSTVGNHAKVSVGDRIVLWDKRTSLGVSVIEGIDTGAEDKLLKRCPSCRRAGIKARRNQAPVFKCYKCGHMFDEPLTVVQRVRTYRSRHDAGWVDLRDTLDASDLRSSAVSPKAQLSLRPLNWGLFTAKLAAKGRGLDKTPMQRRLHTREYGGHVQVTVRARVGQTRFRNDLLKRQGACCAVTGEAPPAALEAAHLYSFAAVGVHHSHGGLLLRRDVHSLFDRGDIAINPDLLAISVRQTLMGFPQYAALHGQPVRVEFESQQQIWLRRHWEQHR